MQLKIVYQLFALITVLVFCIRISPVCAQQGRQYNPAVKGPSYPTVDDVLRLKEVGWSAVISPDGKFVAYTMSVADFDRDAFIEHIWLADVVAGKSYQLTQGERSCYQPRWSPDGAWLTFMSNKVGGKNQIFLIRPEGGQVVQLTAAEAGVSDYAWSENGKSIAFTSGGAEPEHLSARKAHFGDYQVIGKDPAHTHLWTFDFADALKSPTRGLQRTSGYAVNSFSWSPDSSRLAFSGAKPGAVTRLNPDIFVLSLVDNSVRQVVSQPGWDREPQWSPDGKQIIFTSDMGRTGLAGFNYRLAIVAADGGMPRSITEHFDENPRLVEWKADGVYFWARERKATHLFCLDLRAGVTKRVTAPDDLIAGGFSLTRDGRRIAFTATSAKTLGEVFVSDVRAFSPHQLTDMTAQVRELALGTPEVISWKSGDGRVIEGVLVKPKDFDPLKKYPLLCVIHGGPSELYQPNLLNSIYYPIDIWAGRGALILKVNYRGSSGYGREFRQLAYRAFVEEATDILSGIDHLIGKGWVDPAKVGCMGWSHGGYLSALLATMTNRFAAVSVGAGISDWASHYYSSNGTQLALAYLGSDPLTDPEIYRKVSPITYVKQAQTPTLIQHGDLDQSAPIAGAYRLRDALEERRVKVEMIVYKGFGHGINRPRARRAVTEHNLAWFNHYLWGDPLPDFTKPPPMSAQER